MNGGFTEGGNGYFMMFIDDHTRFCYMHFSKSKYEASHHFKIYKTKVENQLEKKIKWLRPDHVGEYLSNEFSKFYGDHDSIHDRTLSYSPQSNRIV
jgi:hypothetical protein